MNPDHDSMPDDPSDETSDGQPLPDELDQGLAYAFGEDSQPDSAPSVIERIGEISGSKPHVLLREERAGDTPMLKPLAPDERLAAGKYVVQGELGRGGVGAVHKGHDQDLGRDVAMKFLHERFKEDGAILHRFVEEAQIGGQLQHPGIVPVYDLGMADDKPFFAMKLVKGETLAKQLAERESPTDDRRTFLAIFEDVCQTLAYAHARGVVHRDLKPANIMIGSFGEVQVVDWGMGKVLSTGGVADEKLAADRQADVSVIETVRSDGHGSQSIVGSVMGTPAYMPPEQARGDVEHMDERSDVFALGAVLCEILTGQPPYVAKSAMDLIGMASMAKLDDAHARLAGCGAEPELIELATRCLMPAPAARPRAAEVVAQAVHDHLAAVESRVHEARVEAAEAKVRAASLKRTQKLGIGLTAVIATGLLVSLWFWREAKISTEKERLAHTAAAASAVEARENEQVAQRELARAVEIKTLITGMLESVTPQQAQGTDTTLLAGILDTASKKLAAGAIQDELVAAELHAVTGNVYRLLGRYPEANRHLPVALELRQRVLGEEHDDTLRSMHDLAILYSNSGRYVEAEPLLLEVLESRRLELGEEHKRTLSVMGNLAIIYLYQGRYEEAEPLFLDTLEIMRRLRGEEHKETLESTQNLAILYSDQGRFADAEPLYRETLEIKRRVLGEEHPSTLGTMGNLASLYQKQGRYADAEALYRETLEIMRRVLGEDHPDTLAFMCNLAQLYSDQGRYADAEPLFLDTLEIMRSVLSEEHPDALRTMGNLAILYQRQRRNEEAEPLFLDTLEIMRSVLGEEHPDTLVVMGSLARLYNQQGRYADAEPLYIETLAIQRRVLGEEHASTLGSITNLGLHYNQVQRFEEAAEMFETSLPIKRRVLGRQHPWTGYAMKGLVSAYLALGRSDEALPLQRERLELSTAAADQDGAHSTVLNDAAWDLLTTEPESLQDPVRALGYAERACALREDEGGKRLGNALDTLALAQHRTGDTAAAVETQRRALSLMPDAAPGKATRLAEYEAALEGQ